MRYVFEKIFGDLRSDENDPIMAQNDPKDDEEPQIFQFPSVYAILVKVPTDFVHWNVEEGQQGKKVLSSMFSEEIKATFQMKKGLELTSKKTKVSDLNVFVQHLSNYR